jgi:hypothetical protein
MSDRKRVLILLAIATALWSAMTFGATLFITQNIATALFVMLIANIPAILTWTVELAILNFFHRRAFKGKSKDNNTSPRQSKTVEIDLPSAEAFDLCQHAIESITGSEVKTMGFTYVIHARLKSAHYDKGEIIGKTRSKWWKIPSFYDEMRITLKLEQVSPTVTRVHIDNRPVLPSVVFDWGYGLNNVNKIALYLREQAHLRNAESHLVASSSNDFVVELEHTEQLEAES